MLKFGLAIIIIKIKFLFFQNCIFEVELEDEDGKNLLELLQINIFLTDFELKVNNKQIK